MTVTGGPEHSEPTIPVRASVAFAWADATKRNANRRAIVNALLDDIEAHRPPPPMPDIEWRAGLRVQRRGAEGQGVGPVYLCRAFVGGLVSGMGEDVLAEVRHEHRPFTDDEHGLYLGTELVAWLPGTEWRVVPEGVAR